MAYIWKNYAEHISVLFLKILTWSSLSSSQDEAEGSKQGGHIPNPDVVLYGLDRPGYSQSHNDGFPWLDGCWQFSTWCRLFLSYFLLTKEKPPSQKGEGGSSVTMLGDFLASSPSKGLYAILSQRLTICKIDWIRQDSVGEFSYCL